MIRRYGMPTRGKENHLPKRTQRIPNNAGCLPIPASFRSRRRQWRRTPQRMLSFVQAIHLQAPLTRLIPSPLQGEKVRIRDEKRSFLTS